MRYKRGQAAIEFLVTYGWAIMAAMIVIAALTYFGITNPSTSLPDKCVFSNGFDCKDFQITSTAINIKILNTAGQTVYGTGDGGNITVSLAETGAECSMVNGEVTFLDPEEIMDVSCPGDSLKDYPFTVREKQKVKLTITYSRNPPPNGYPQTALGEVYAAVQ